MKGATQLIYEHFESNEVGYGESIEKVGGLKVTK